MSEQDVRDGLRHAVSAEPPLSLDPDSVIAAAHRQTKRRRALAAVGMATVLIAVAAVALPVALGRDPSPVRAGDQPAYTSWPPPGIKPVTYTADQLRRRGVEMRAHLDDRLGKLLPDASDIQVGPFGGEAEGAVADGQNYLNAFATFTIDQTRYGIAVDVFAPGAGANGPDVVCAQTYCEQLDARGGGLVLARTEDLGDGKIRAVHHFRVNGTQVSAVAYNYDPTANKVPTYAPTIPVTDSQLAELATDPALGL